MKRSNTSEDDLRSEGGRSPKRFKAGGGVRVKNLNIVAVHPKHPPMAMGAMQPPPGQIPGAPGMGGPAPTLAPPGPPGMPVPPMRKHGGRIKKDYGPSEPVSEDISEYRAAKARGGAFSGVGRLEQAEKTKKREG
jgi:hypothetical protein